MTLRGKAASIRPLAIVAAVLLGAVLALAWAGGSASAASIVAKDGRIHACVKAKGKGKGTLRVVRGAKVKCPRGWKKTAWSAAGPAGSGGANGENGSGGAPGESGAGGTNGTTGTSAATSAKVTSLETQVTDLLSKVKSLEAVLKGVTPEQLQAALAAVPVVSRLCDQTEALNAQTASLGSTLGALVTVVDLIPGVTGLPAVPAALPAFACP
jgi:hypothetical protein